MLTESEKEELMGINSSFVEKITHMYEAPAIGIGNVKGFSRGLKLHTTKRVYLPAFDPYRTDVEFYVVSEPNEIRQKWLKTEDAMCIVFLYTHKSPRSIAKQVKRLLKNLYKVYGSKAESVKKRLALFYVSKENSQESLNSFAEIVAVAYKPEVWKC